MRFEEGWNVNSQFLYQVKIKEGRLACEDYCFDGEPKPKRVLQRLHFEVDYHVDGSMVYFRSFNRRRAV